MVEGVRWESRRQLSISDEQSGYRESLPSPKWMLIHSKWAVLCVCFALGWNNRVWLVNLSPFCHIVSDIIIQILTTLQIPPPSLMQGPGEAE